MSRREFTKSVYAAIVKRAMQANGEIACEGCGLILGRKPYHIDHTDTVPDALQIDKGRKLTADDGKLLGIECCHKPKTVQDQGKIAKAKRNKANHLGFKTAPAKKLRGAPFPKSSKPKHERQALPPRQLYEAKP
ncbi:hypothetical protein J2046_004177 [Rhizobium petrolearium]|uniref:hypothetical protein n=1 Tax=Neorhizobium petrolearium TaxID=515361 RepID=UPI001AEA669B|nr:hypothetical protein [Neorhizobium petrolearium]MBP1845903.1 hypothetical protein [Neorhizobium petrolearium]